MEGDGSPLDLLWCHGTSSFRLTNGLPLSEDTLLRWMRNKELKAYRLGKTYRVTKEDYQECLAQRYTGKSDAEGSEELPTRVPTRYI